MWRFEPIQDSSQFAIATGSPEHIVNKVEHLLDYVEFDEPQVVECSPGLYRIAYGSGYLILKDSSCQRNVVLDPVLFAPEVPVNMVSMGALDKAGYCAVLRSRAGQVTLNGETVMNIRMSEGLFVLNAKPKKPRHKKQYDYGLSKE